MSPPGSDDGKTAPGTKVRYIRLGDVLWDNAEIVSKALGTDRSGLVRDFLRWATFEDGAMPPRRPATRPEGLKLADPLPDGIQMIIEGSIKSRNTTKPRYVIHVDASVDDVLAPIIAAGLGDDAAYLDTSPVAISTLDRELSVRMLAVLTDAGLHVVKP